MNPDKSTHLHYNESINNLLSAAQVVSQSLSGNKKPNKTLENKVNQINKDIQKLREEIKADKHRLGPKVTHELIGRLYVLERTLKLDKLTAQDKKLPEAAAAASSNVQRSTALQLDPSLGAFRGTYIAILPTEVRRMLFTYILASNPKSFIAKFNASFLPTSIDASDALVALRYIEKTSPEAKQEIREQRDQGKPYVQILHEFFTERFQTLLYRNEHAKIMEIIAAEKPLYHLDNVAKLVSVPSHKKEVSSEIAGLDEGWRRFFDPERLHDARSRIPWTGEYTYAIFERNTSPEVRQYCIDKFIIMSDIIKHNYQTALFSNLLDLNKSNAEILAQVKDYLNGLIESAHIRGDLKLLEVTDSLRCELAFARIENSLAKINEIMMGIRENQNNEYAKSRLITELETENKKLSEYLSSNWSKLGELSRKDGEFARQFAALESRLLLIGHHAIAETPRVPPSTTSRL